MTKIAINLFNKQITKQYINLVTTRLYNQLLLSKILSLTHCGLVTPYGDRDLGQPDMPLQNLENQEISGKKTGDLTKNQEIVSNKFCSLSHLKLCIFSLIFNT